MSMIEVSETFKSLGRDARGGDHTPDGWAAFKLATLTLSARPVSLSAQE